MPDANNIGWAINVIYDYRFAGLSVRIKHGDEDVPPFHISLRNVLAKMPRHEVLSCLQMVDDPNIGSECSIEVHRRGTIRNTDLAGKTVLDIGGYDGWAAALALECGAARAICLDNHQYEHYGWKDKKFDGVEYITGDVMPWVPQVDVLINYNVLYHTKNPWAFLDKCREIIKPDGEMLLCTLFRYHNGPWMYVYEPRECNPDDDTVYFGPSISALERLLKHTGWDIEQEGLSYDRVVYRCKPTANWQRTHEDT